MTSQELKQTLWRDAAQNGLILGGSLVAIVIISIITRMDMSMPYASSIAQHLIMIVLLMQFCKKRGAKYGAAGFGYGQNMNFILATMLFTGIIVGISTFILQQYIAPEYYKEVVAMALEQNSISSSQVTSNAQELLDTAMAMMRNPVLVVLSGMFGMLINGGFIGIFVAIFTRRLPEPESEKDTDSDENNKQE